MQQRNKSLDALRGLAILAMVLSSSIAFGILPAWMYHAQEPPPSHVFNPNLPGISWVDLVFPFFLFSMGAAIPLSLHKLEKEKNAWIKVLQIAVRRYLLLAFFALFTLHARTSFLSSHPKPLHYLLSVAAFVLLFFMLLKPPNPKLYKWFTVFRVLAFAGGIAMMALLPFKNGKGFSFQNSDIIIIVLANMAFFGSIIWWFTRKHPWLRLGLLPFVMAVLLGAGTPDSWNEALFNWSPLPWLYQFYYLKYLFIILPATLAGEWMLKDREYPVLYNAEEKDNLLAWPAILSFSLVVLNVILLYGRHTIANLFVSSILCLLLYLQTSRSNKMPFSVKKFAKAGIYLLLLGLFFESYQSGIKKDPSTFSYYFVSTGLAFLMMLALYGWQKAALTKRLIDYLSLNGRNPMVAYVTGNLLLLPVLHLTGGYEIYTGMQNRVIPGFISGILFTGLVSLITVWFTRRRWFWKS
jgi:predicted acyltransferase